MSERAAVPRFWFGRGWSVLRGDGQLTLEHGARSQRFTHADLHRLSVSRRWWRWTLTVRGDRAQHFTGLSRTQALSLRAATAILAAEPEVAAAAGWQARVQAVLAEATRAGRWIPREVRTGLTEARPDRSLPARLAELPGALDHFTGGERAAIAFAGTDLDRLVAATNEQIVARELVENRHFFDHIEKSPLTEEQARAVICLDNRVQVVAAAGSGKTSVMMARAAYAVHKGVVAPERILLLAFNRKAADELERRVRTRLGLAGIDATGIRATTFHAFGLAVLGEATGRKPRLAQWAEPGQDVRAVSDIVDELRDASTTFRYRWDLFRLLFARVSDRCDGGEPDGYDRRARRDGFTTFSGRVVRSEGERLIADWLFVNGVEFEYERDYVVDTSGVHHSRYRPDFYYPKADVWHEHWAIDHDGKAPASFTNYAQSMEWKRQLHRRHQTTLVESTFAQIVLDGDFDPLRETLTAHGLAFDWNPDRPLPGAQPVEHEELARSIRTFMTHVKSAAHTRASLDALLAADPERFGSYRTRLFLELYWPIHEQWQQRLHAGNLVDFDDMLVAAAEHLERGTHDPGYELVMADEFQDANRARARILAALVSPPGRLLLTVGDDWQSINRFAGADMAVMTEFATWFGAGPTLALSTTFRCPQSVADSAGAFVAKNPRQLRKRVRSALPEPGPPITLRYGARGRLDEALAAHLEELAARVRGGELHPGDGGAVSVFVLGRFRHDRDLVPRRVPRELRVQFLTAHGAKGLEADVVVLPHMVRGHYGFPSEITDDPVLDLVMAAPDGYPHAEERRLFYVALTRARREVTLITVAGQESSFVTELIADGLVDVAARPEATPIEVCPRCGQGTMVARTGRYGDFLGCSRFPRCKHSRNRG